MKTSLAHRAAHQLIEGRLFTRYATRESNRNATIYTFADDSQIVIPRHGWQQPIVITAEYATPTRKVS